MTKETRKHITAISKQNEMTRNEFMFILHNLFDSKAYDMAKAINETPSYLVDIVNYRKILNKEIQAKLIKLCSDKVKKKTKAS